MSHSIYIALGHSMVGRQIADALRGDARFDVIGDADETVIVERDLGSMDALPRCLVLAADLRAGNDLERVVRRIVRKHHINVVVVGTPDDAHVLTLCLSAGAVHTETVATDSVGAITPQRVMRVLHLINLMADVRGLDVLPGQVFQDTERNTRTLPREALPAESVGSLLEPTFTRDPSSPGLRAARFKLVGIVSSTGGLHAVETVLKSLPHGFDVPIAVVQHLGHGGDHEFARILERRLPFNVSMATHGAKPMAGHVYVAPEGAHLIVNDIGRFEVRATPTMTFMPSGDVFFRSLAQQFGARAVGVVLTGMGGDGADGLLSLRQAGGRTFAQDEASSTVFGMPQVAIAKRAAQSVLPLSEIGPALVRLVGSAP